MSNEPVTYTKEQLEAMPPEEANNLMMKACKIEGFAVVKDKHGVIKYDDISLKGTYHETE